jgi:hypothetical protein
MNINIADFSSATEYDLRAYVTEQLSIDAFREQIENIFEGIRFVL